MTSASPPEKASTQRTTRNHQTTTLPESEGVQEDDKTSTVPLHRDKPRAHIGAWLTQNLGLPTEEAFRAKHLTP
ncbi:hypothetical protein Taro_048342 [Colocasia esculenta]|uniref:Uncharacterized protein n=1 Tax=Colocasia esculenta TaxID=4460 RepID=A0A843X2P1_COLES|nr:hypothetical protein [Colocasia esculenta]